MRKNGLLASGNKTYIRKQNESLTVMHWSSLMLMKNIIFKLFILRILLSEHQISLSEMDLFLYIQLQLRELNLLLSLLSLTSERSFKQMVFHISFLNGYYCLWG